MISYHIIQITHFICSEIKCICLLILVSLFVHWNNLGVSCCFDVALVSITVSPKPNYIPVAFDDSLATVINHSVDIDVLVNDSNLNDGGLVVTTTSSPSNGTVSVNDSNIVTYTPSADYLGYDSFTYKVCDADGDCDSATVLINVKETNISETDLSEII